MPDDFEEEPLPAHGRRAAHKLLGQFRRVESLMSPDRIKHEDAAAKWQGAIASKAFDGLSPDRAQDVVGQVLEEPLMHVDVGKHASRRSPATKQGKKSPGARLVAALTLARKDERRRTSSYLVKPDPPAALKPKTPPRWRVVRSPPVLKRLLLQQNRAGHEEQRQGNAPGCGEKRVSWMSAARKANDSLDEFMQLPAPPLPPPGNPAPPAVSNIQDLCLARRRAVMLEMGVDADSLHPTLRGYARPSEAAAAATAAPRGAGDALDAFLAAGV